MQRLSEDVPVIEAPASSSVRRDRSAAALALLSVLIATLFIAGTYGVFNQTYDEPAHLACGMEWLDRGVYDYDYLHPPLGRVAIAFLPFCAGLRSHGEALIWNEGNRILASDGLYMRNLTLARLGVLPFFWLSCWLVWHWTRRFMGATWGALSVALYTTNPSVLAHSSIATTDMPVTALILLAVTMRLCWRENSGTKTSICMGLATGAAVTAKFSAIPFLILIYAVLELTERAWFQKPKMAATWRIQALAATGFTIWAVHRFSVGPTSFSGIEFPFISSFLKRPGLLQSGVHHAMNLVPAPEFFLGLQELYLRNSVGQWSYFMGEISQSGRLYFFPVLLLAKLPVPILLLAATGLIYALLPQNQRHREFTSLLLVGIFCPLVFACISNVNLGSRHVLVIMPFVAMLAAAGAYRIWTLIKLPVARGLVIGLFIAANAFSCWSAAPDFLSYFNEPTRQYASYITAESDLDYGQDLNRLCAVLAHYPTSGPVLIAYQGSADLSRVALPPWRELLPRVPSKGVIAISLWKLKTYPDRYGWLNQYHPVQTVGHSILLYDIK